MARRQNHGLWLAKVILPLAVVFALPIASVSAQPKPAPAGSTKPATSTKPVAATKDGGAPAASSAPAASNAAGSGDGGAPAPEASSAEPVPQTAPSGAMTSYEAPSIKKSAPPPPPPSKDQVAALDALKGEMTVYETGAKDYRDAVTTIIKLHYEIKKKEILSGLDREIAIEQAELKKARENAIKRLEEFIATYTGSRSHPEASPDAMYRLAALYEERARAEDNNDPLEETLKPAIALYKRIIVEYPKYREIAGIYYFLGHAFVDSGRMDEGQQVWRSLVCHNKYPYPTAEDPKKPGHDTITPLPQDHDEAYWIGWRAQHRDPKSALAKRNGPDGTYVDPYPQDCRYVEQTGLRPGDEPKYVSEVWWQIGNWEFDQLDFGSGIVRDEPASVYGYNRAASAYQQSMKYKRPPLYGVSLYKYSWTLFKQQRYEAATKEFVHLLNYTDEQQKLTGDPGADFRGEAYTYIAGSLTNVDFVGPGPDEPFIQRPDIIDTEPRPEVQEKKLHIAFERVKDPALIPQDKTWTIEIYKALGSEYRSLNQFVNAIEVYEEILKKWPMDPTAPEVQNGIAETYDQMNYQKKPGTPEHDAIAGKALEARTKLANYIGTTAWTDANKDNPAALQNAERLVRGGLRQAAAAHTNNGKSALLSASETGDAARQIELLARAREEYKLAAIGWAGYIKQDENAPDAYESRYWHADATRQMVRIQVILHKLNKDKFGEPTRAEIDAALMAAVEVRDSNEDDKYLDNAAFFVVDISDVDRDLAYQRFDDSKGTQGTQKRDEVKFNGDDPTTRSVVADTIPPVVLKSVQARDEYILRVPPALDTNKNSLEYQYYAAEVFFLYGQFEIARQRFETMWKDHCAKDEYGYKAWEKLITMSNLMRDTARSTKLAEEEKTHSCAVNPEQQAKAGIIVNPTLQEAAFLNARKKFEQAKNSPPGPDRDRLWREAAGLYEAALQAAPGRDEAPEAAMNAAYAYKQVGEYAKAIELYNKFIAEYGSEERLNKLQKGDPKAKVGPEPKKYAERLQYLNDAYDALGTTYYGFFNYQRAAETYEKVSQNERFDAEKRKIAAKNAMIIFANMGQREKMVAEYNILRKLNPNPDERANADYLIADYDHKQWNPTGGDTGANQKSRQAGTASLIAFYNTNKSSPGAARYLVEAAYNIAKMQKSVQDGTYRAWLKNTIGAWENFKQKSPPGKDGKSDAMGPPYADYAAEADLTLVDEQVKEKFDTDARHKYQGAVSDIVGEVDPKTQKTKTGKYQENAKESDKWDKELERVARTYPSVDFVPAAYARRGAVFDTLRTGLYNVVPPALKYFTPKEEAFLKQLENSGRDDLAEKADEFRTLKKEFWRSKKEQELAGADQLMIRHYATAIALARKYNVRNAYTQKAQARLAYFTDLIGEAKMKEYVTATADPTDANKKLEYKDGQYIQQRPGLLVIPQANGAGTPLPVAP